MTREKEIFKVTILGGVGNLLLLAFKFIAGFLGHSSAMIADAVHSFSDFATDVIVLVFVRISGKPQDKDHDYGHGKYETLATTIIGLALLAVAVGIFYGGARKIITWAGGGQLAAPGMLAFWAAVASILVKELIYQYTVRKSLELSSDALKANAWHHRSDALSSIGTAVGIGGAIFLGPRWAVLDPLACIVVSVFIVKVAVDLLRNGVNELTEQSLPDDVEEEIQGIVLSHPLVTEPHHLRTRRIGNKIAIEMHIRMDGNTTLIQADQCSDEIEEALKARFGQDTHIIIHVEPIK